MVGTVGGSTQQQLFAPLKPRGIRGCVAAENFSSYPTLRRNRAIAAAVLTSLNATRPRACSLPETVIGRAKRRT
jgi:hypothetical protein